MLSYECYAYDGAACEPADGRCVAKAVMGEDCVPVYYVLVKGGKPLDSHAGLRPGAGTMWCLTKKAAFDAYVAYLKGGGPTHYTRAVGLFRGA